MKDRKNTKGKLHKRKRHVVAGLVATLFLLCLSAGLLIAKYYAGHSNKGVATASRLYFTSNLLKNVKGKEQSEYPVIYNTTAWDGTDACELGVQIRNFQSQLYFNDLNLDVVYNITFELVTESDGGTYTVSYSKDGSTQTVPITENGVTISDMKLQGGKANYNAFTVSVRRPDSESGNSNYRSVGIRVIATPVSPSYVTDGFQLGGILYATMASAKYSLSAEFSKVTDPIENYSGFPYTITYMPGKDNVAHELHISWDSSLELDAFNDDYAQAKSENKIGTENGRRYMNITIQPYSSIQITFYRNSGFSVTDKAGLEKLVTVTDSSLEGSESDE